MTQPMMKPWERTVIEYRPTIGITTEVVAKVEKKSEAVFKPTVLANRASQILGADVLDSLLASLSKASELQKLLDKSLSSYPAYREYKSAAQQGDSLWKREVQENQIKDLSGRPVMDVVPLLEALAPEMERYLDYINKELFDGAADYSNPELVRVKEEKDVNVIFLQESEGKNIDYDALRARIQFMAIANEKVGMFRNYLDLIDGYLMTKTKDIVDGDTKGLVYYMSKMIDSPSSSAVKEAMMSEFRRTADQAILALHNMDRICDRGFREMLDQKISEVRKKMDEVYRPLLPFIKDDTMDSVGAEPLRMVLLRGAEQVKDTYEGLLTEQLTTIMQVQEQMLILFDYLKEKKAAQLLYTVFDTVSEEYDPSNPDKEVNRLIRKLKLDAPATYTN